MCDRVARLSVLIILESENLTFATVDNLLKEKTIDARSGQKKKDRDPSATGLDSLCLKEWRETHEKQILPK